MSYRRFYHDLPMLAVYNSTGTTRKRVILFSEVDNQVTSNSIGWRAVDDVPPIVTHDKTIHPQPKGYRLSGSVAFRIYGADLSALPEDQNQAQGFAFTERDIYYLRRARLDGSKILCYPRQSRDYGYDTRFVVYLPDEIPMVHANGVTAYADCVLTVEGITTTTTPPDEF